MHACKMHSSCSLINSCFQDAITAGLETGVSTFVMHRERRADFCADVGAAEGAPSIGRSAADWKQLGRFRCLFIEANDQIVDEEGSKVHN